MCVSVALVRDVSARLHLCTGTPARHTGVMLSNTNPHERDPYIFLDEESHTYHVRHRNGLLSTDANDWCTDHVSVSALWASKFDHFDPDACLSKYFSGWASNSSSKYYCLIQYLDLVEGRDEEAQKDAIKSLWHENGVRASKLGTAFHKQAENYMNGLPWDDGTPEIRLFEHWLREFAQPRNLRPYRTEMSVFDLSARVAGQIDSLWADEEGKLCMIDWKRCNPKERRDGRLDVLSPAMECFANRRGLPPFQDVPDTSYGHYCVQQNCYKYMLEQCYGWSVQAMFLVQCHPAMSSPHTVAVPDMQAEVSQLFDERRKIFA